MKARSSQFPPKQALRLVDVSLLDLGISKLGDGVSGAADDDGLEQTFDFWIAFEELVDQLVVELDGIDIFDGDDVRGPLLTRHERDLAEEGTRLERGELDLLAFTLDRDLHLAPLEQVKVASLVALTKDHVARCVGYAFARRQEPLPILFAEGLEEV